MRSNVPPLPPNPKVAAAVTAGIITVTAASSPAGATELALPPKQYLDVYIEAAANSECGLDWTLLGGIAGVSSNHTITNNPPQRASPDPTNDTPPGVVPVALAIDDPSTPEPDRGTSEPAHPTNNENENAEAGWPLVVDADAIGQAIALAFPPPPDTPTIYGPNLDGTADTRLITDTDRGAIDEEFVWDRAVGPFQFIPTTWNTYGIDGNGDGIANPQNLEDAAASAANLLCAVKANQNPTEAIASYYGTNINNQRVFEHAAELRTHWQTLQPPPPVTPATAGNAGVAAADIEIENADGIVVASRIAEPVRAMIAAAKADGINLQGWGWRSHTRQIELRAAHCADIWLTPSNQCTPPTATPGHSMHEIGEAIDFFTGDDQHTIGPSDPQHAWLTANAATYGFFNLPSETWHWSTTGH